MYDNPDIVQVLNQVWVEDYANIHNYKDIVYMVEKMQEYVERLYEVLYYDEFFKYIKINPTHSACVDQKLYELRQRLVRSALRYDQVGNQGAKEMFPPEEIT